MNRFQDAFERGHGIEFDAFRFDSPDYDALMVTGENYLEHLRVQAAGLAYYGTLAKTMERECDELERRYKSRYNEMYSECSDILMRAGKNKNQKDVDSFVRCKFENELQNWERELAEAKANKDGAMGYYEAWKAKGFALSSMTSLITAGLLTPKTTITETDVEESSRRRSGISEILKRK